VRIVSLLASATETVCALGAGEMLVGRSHECDNPPWVKALPACSGPAFDISISSGEIDLEVRRRVRAGEPLYHIHTELIRSLKPDLVITQSHCEVCAVTPADLERSGGYLIPAGQLSMAASTLDEIYSSIQRIAERIGLEERGRTVVAAERRRLECVRERSTAFRRPTVAVLEWTDPMFAIGNWGPELVEIANGELLLGKIGEYSIAIPAERLRDADPEFLIVAPCGFDLERTLREQATLERMEWWSELRAVREGKVVFADGNLFFNRSGITVSRTAEIIAEILHGISFDAPAGENYSGEYRRRLPIRAAPQL
jgi:iron complex transport system substrate-binding protein